MGLDFIEIVQKAEKRFSIEIPDAEAEKIVTVGDLHNIVWYLLPAGHKREEMEVVINTIIADQSGLDPEDITADKKIVDDQGID